MIFLDLDIAGLFTGPVGAIEKVADEKLKRALEEKAVSFGYSQYVTFFYSLGNSLKGRRFIGVLSEPFRRMAASAYVMMVGPTEQQIKSLSLAVPADLQRETQLLESIHYEEIDNPKGA